MQDKYLEMCKYVQDIFSRSDVVAKVDTLPFRNRMEHTKRVYKWAERILKTEAADSHVVLTSAIFHDVGYAVFNGKEHSENSGVICEKYLTENGYDEAFIRKVVYIVENHSDKNQLSESTTSIEHAILMEADLLDETGAMGVVWDCMDEGNNAEQSYEKTLKRLKSRSAYKYPDKNPMCTTTAKQLWEEKQRLFKAFVDGLEYDLYVSHK